MLLVNEYITPNHPLSNFSLVFSSSDSSHLTEKYLQVLVLMSSTTTTIDLPTTIPAVQLTQVGGPEAIKDAEIPLPVPKPDEVLVKVEWGGVNYRAFLSPLRQSRSQNLTRFPLLWWKVDIYLRLGYFPVPFFPSTVGTEISGTIVSLPTSAAVLEDPAYVERRLSVGAKVVAMAEAMRVRTSPSSRPARLLNHPPQTASGFFQTYITVPWDLAVPLPSTISTRVAAASFAQGLTALTFATEAYAVQKGDWVLVHAVAGGVGLQLCQVRTDFLGFSFDLSTRCLTLLGR